MHHNLKFFFLLILLLSGCLRYEADKAINKNNAIDCKLSATIEGKFIDLPNPIYNDSLSHYYDILNIKLDSEKAINLRNLKIKNILVFGKFLTYINNNGNIFLFNKDNINENDYIWEVKLDLKNQPLNEAEFAYNSSDIFILVNRRYLYSLNIDNGNINWKYDYKSLSESHLLLHDDSIYLSSIDGTLTDIDANKGIINWIYNGFGSVSDDRIIRKNERINLAIKYNILIYTPYNGGTHAIDPRKGNLLWNIDFTDYIKDKNKDKNLKDIFDIKPYIFDANGIKKVIIGSSNGSFLCVTLKGELEWINDFGSKTKPFFINNNIFVFSKDEIKIFDINKQNNYHNLWKIKFKNLQSNSYNGIKEGFIVNNEILLITKNNEFLKFNPYAKDDELVINYENHDNLNGYHIAMGNIYIY